VAAVAVTVRLLGSLGGGVVVRGRVATFLGERVAEVAGYGAARAVVAAVLDPPAERFDRRRSGVVLDGGGLSDRVGLDGGDARAPPEDALDDPLLGGVMEAADVDDGRGPAVVSVPVAHRVLANRCTAASSSSLFWAAVSWSPDASASATQ